MTPPYKVAVRLPEGESGELPEGGRGVDVVVMPVAGFTRYGSRGRSRSTAGLRSMREGSSEDESYRPEGGLPFASSTARRPIIRVS
jgi:hypothetical protein